jgi:hypothetical protein
MNFFKYHSNNLIVAHNFIISPDSILTWYEGWNHYAMNPWIASNIQLKYSYISQNRLAFINLMKVTQYQDVDTKLVYWFSWK